jgi:hypothetical protein
VADAPVPPPLPAAIRITRPYATEEEFLDRELDTLTRASITLLGAQSRPQGVVLRFELVLVSGIVLVRGEGRVVGFKANAFEGLGGLTLRFTRLDTKSKGLIDRAAALREQRRPSTRPPAHEAAPSIEPPPVPPPPTTLPGLPRPATPFAQESGVVTSGADAAPPSEPSPPVLKLAADAHAPSLGKTSEPPRAPPELSQTTPDGTKPAGTEGRETVLDRLRKRAKSLDPTDIARILAGRR